MTMVKWQAFGCCNHLTSTIAHFFPESKGAFVPYPVDCKISVFGNGMERRSVTLEGARIGSPDGVKIEETFPALKDLQAGEGSDCLYGLEISISSPQPNLDLSPSSCVIELTSAGSSTKFRPRQMPGADEETPDSFKPGLAVQDEGCSSFLVIVNGKGDTYSPTVLLSACGDFEPKGVPVPEVPGESVAELPVNGGCFSGIKPLESRLGIVRSGSIAVEGERTAGSSVFLVYRDDATRRPGSVYAL